MWHSDTGRRPVVVVLHWRVITVESADVNLPHRKPIGIWVLPVWAIES
jgi:hypothetical protein